jgi:hypothetical protein
MWMSTRRLCCVNVYLHVFCGTSVLRTEDQDIDLFGLLAQHREISENKLNVFFSLP